MENTLIYLGYGIAFLMAFLSMLIELKNKYGPYFQFTAKSFYSYLYCGAYGIVGFVGFWLYQSGMSSVDSTGYNNQNPIIRTVVTAMIIGWSAKGLLDAPLLPASGKNDDNEGFRFRILVNFIFLNANTRFNNIIARKQRSYFDKCIKAFTKNDPGKGDPKKDFEKRVYTFLDVHPGYGSGSAMEVAQFNTFMTQFAKQTDIESSFRFAYRNLGYNVFKAIIRP
jgi:hypothetical protein